MGIDRDVYENGTAKLLIDHHNDGTQSYWVQVGFVTMQLQPEEIYDLDELLHALAEEIGHE